MLKKNRNILLIALLLCFFYLLLLFGSVSAFMPAAGAKVVARQASQDRLLTGRDSRARLLPGEKLDLNSASPEELSLLEGIGPALSDAIVLYRESNGPFETEDELLLVPGIGEKKLAAILDHITVGGEP